MPAQLKRMHAWPQGHWNWPIPVSHKHGLKCGEMIFVGGQVDLDSKGTVLHPGDLPTQTDAVMRNIADVLAELGADMGDLVKLVAFYVNDGTGDEAAFLARIANHLPAGDGPVITAVPLPALAYPGMVVEILAMAMRGADGERLARRSAAIDGLAALPRPFSHVLRCKEMIFTSGLAPIEASGRVYRPGDLLEQSRFVMEQLGAGLAAYGAGYDDSVKLNIYYTGGGRFEDWQGAARVRAGYFTEPGPAATGIPVPRHANTDVRTKIELIAMLGEDGSRLPRIHVWPPDHWDWPIHLPYKHGLKCGRMIFIGGQVALTPAGVVMSPDDLVAQTRIAMEFIRRVLAGLGARFEDVVSLLTFYEGGASGDVLHANLKIRSGCFAEPGPTSTGIPIPFLAYDTMVIEIEAMAITP
jgi:enamine deaminase RidA (YjgF/YER057c/UK114 family)